MDALVGAENIEKLVGGPDPPDRSTFFIVLVYTRLRSEQPSFGLVAFLP